MNSKRRGFDDDTSMEILLRLPIKCVIRFQIVSKNWLSLISSDHFRREHTLRNHHKPPACHIITMLGPSLRYFNTVTKPTKIIPLSLNIPSYCVITPTILSCCNGLVVLRRGLDLHVYNPMTRQSRKIILPRTDSYFYVGSKLHLVFDDSKSPHYKIVYIRAEQKARSQTHTIEVFSSESGRWKACMEPITVPSEFCFATSVCCNNKIYGTKRYDGDGSLYCIDIDKNVLRFLASPTVAGRNYNIASIQEWNGYLYCAALYSDLICLWEKDKDDDDKWLLKYEDRLPPILVSSLEIIFVPQTSTLLVAVHPRKIMAYNFLDKSCNQLLDFSLDKSCNQLLDFSRLQNPWGFGNMHLFCETLAPV